jgi:Icc-related predicted phosphoesterase
MSSRYGFNPFGFDLPFGFEEDEIAKEAKSVWMEEINKRK